MKIRNVGVATIAVWLSTPALSSTWEHFDLKENTGHAARQTVKATDNDSAGLTMTVIQESEQQFGVVFTLENDQLDCTDEDCKMTVQFDVGTVKIIDIVPDHARPGKFVPVKSAAFSGALTMAQRLSIELPVKSQGTVKFELDVADLLLKRTINPAFTFAGLKLGEMAAGMSAAFKPDQISPAVDCRKASHLNGVIPGQDQISARVCLFAGLFYEVAIQSKNREEYESIAAYLISFYRGTGFDSAYPASLMGVEDIARHTSHAVFFRKDKSEFEGYFYVTDDVIDFLVPKNLKLIRSAKKPTL
jgi:hypothetical protein